jgi:hypothetical protein
MVTAVLARALKPANLSCNLDLVVSSKDTLSLGGIPYSSSRPEALVQPALRSTVSEYRIHQTILESKDRIRGVPDHVRACGSIHAARSTVPAIVCMTSGFPEIQGVVLVC